MLDRQLVANCYYLLRLVFSCLEFFVNKSLTRLRRKFSQKKVWISVCECLNIFGISCISVFIIIIFFCYTLHRVHLSINDRIYQLTCVHQSTIETWRWGLARQRRRRLSTHAKRSKAKSPTIFMICKVATYVNTTLVTVPFLSLQGFCSHCCPPLVQ